ncbi:medium-chain acyl-CoA ligase ACSF2, mitochondrial [Danaus plexippus]|uniref:medium-chain acyl-CoA ligase ACSF2, mitochondrial n=1 Tax=Danaus plexippus TaxID=13037 RepID=UPI002AB20DF1|nr:medium-chain acyl-CoA ligase ACSF2, mitochondrial [Danaus plexippus]
MFDKIAARFIKDFKNFQLRESRRFSTVQDSHLKNPGSEPLIAATFGDRLADAAHRNPGKIAIKSIHEDVTLTYEDLMKKADSFGCGLQAVGYEAGDKLGIWSHNCSQWVIAVIGAVRAGIIPVLINPMYEKSELSYCINKTELKGLFIGETIRNKNYNKTLYEVLPELYSCNAGGLATRQFPNLSSVITAGKEKTNAIFNMDNLIDENINRNPVIYGSTVKPEDVCIVHFTSGSTGNPKAVQDSHLGVVNTTYFSGLRSNFNEDHQIICVQTPLFHALGSIITLMTPLHHGATVVIASPVYSPSASLHAVCSENCTSITGTPTMYVDMLSTMKNRDDLSLKLKSALVAGAPCSPELIRRINDRFKAKVVRNLYGLTECTATVFQSMPDDRDNLVTDTVGYITDHVEVKVVDSSGNMVPFGCQGELAVRGYNNMINYLNDPIKTKETLRDGWLYTGDTFTLTPDGYGKLVGRSKDVIIRGGENIAPKEIEDCINTHSNVIESQVVGLADERLGEEICAVVRLHDNATMTLEDLKKHCFGKLATFKIPKILKIMENFPKTASGKVQKYRIKELIESGKL